jgi:hypothetical protein
VVAPLLNQPVVVSHASGGGKPWLTMSQSWYLDPNRDDVYYAESGPSKWQRVDAAETNPPRTALAPVQVSHAKTADDSVSFDVDTTGVPVLVRTSYFPNWHVSGAKGPYRVTPNLMVVIPTSHHVRLHYGWTPVDLLGILLTLLGVAAVTWLDSAEPVSYPAPKVRVRAPAPAPDAPVAAAAEAPFVDPYRRLEEVLAAAEAGNGHDSDLLSGATGGSFDAAAYLSEGPHDDHPAAPGAGPEEH